MAVHPPAVVQSTVAPEGRKWISRSAAKLWAKSKAPTRTRKLDLATICRQAFEDEIQMMMKKGARSGFKWCWDLYRFPVLFVCGIGLEKRCQFVQMDNKRL